MMMTPTQTQYVAALVAELRPGWDPQGIRAALLKAANRDAFDVALAALRAAREPGNRTPAVIPLAGPHWESSKPPAVPRADRVRSQVEAVEAACRERESARASRLAARAACSECDDAGRTPSGAWCAHSAVVLGGAR